MSPHPDHVISLGVQRYYISTVYLNEDLKPIWKVLCLQRKSSSFQNVKYKLSLFNSGAVTVERQVFFLFFFSFLVSFIFWLFLWQKSQILGEGFGSITSKLSRAPLIPEHMLFIFNMLTLCWAPMLCTVYLFMFKVEFLKINDLYTFSLFLYRWETIQMSNL